MQGSQHNVKLNQLPAAKSYFHETLEGRSAVFRIHAKHFYISCVKKDVTEFHNLQDKLESVTLIESKTMFGEQEDQNSA